MNVETPKVSRESQILGAVRSLRSVDAARMAGVSLRSARRFWRALGFPAASVDVYAYTHRDAEALRRMATFVSSGVLSERQALEMVRAIGRSVDRMAAWQVQVLHDVVRDQDDSSHHHAREAQEAEDLAELVTSMVNHLEPLVIHAWRRHLVSALSDQVADLVPPEGIQRGVRSVGFIDMVGFTQAVRALDRHDVAVLVERFERVVSDLIAVRDLRLVKTIGDEVMFMAQDPESAVRLGVDAVEAVQAAGLPQVRVGVATGDVVDRLGDVFGTTVNRASRLTETGIPSAVIVDRDTVRALTGDLGATTVADLSVAPLPRAPLKGIGDVPRYCITRSRQPGASGRYDGR